MAATEAVAFTSRAAIATSNRAISQSGSANRAMVLLPPCTKSILMTEILQNTLANLRTEISVDVKCDHAQAAGGHLAMSAERSASWYAVMQP